LATTPPDDNRTVSSEEVFAGRLIRVTVDRVTLPSGEEKDREIVLHPGAVAILPVLPNERIILVRQYRHAVGDSLWEIPAGLIDPGECALESAKRELREETGYSAEKWRRLFSFFTSPGFTNEEITLYMAEQLSKIGHFDPQEIDAYDSYSMSELVRMIETGSIRDAKTVLGIFFLQSQFS
jgi:ADP-ribose pyrophosphatase